MTDAVELFIIDAQARRLSSATIRTYSNRLAKFTAWCADNDIDDIQSISSHHIRLFQIHLQNYSAKFQHNVSGALRTFFNFCVAEQILQGSPFANVRMPKLPNRILPSFSRQDIDTLIAHCKTERDHAILLFCWIVGYAPPNLSICN
ncbi:MAG: phage integrase N-terminal SAM-like domain-containing protein [Caldilineaceae bacterium]